MLDPCRDNPLAEALERSVGTTRTATVQNGLAKMDAAQGMIVAYSTQAGRLASDGFGLRKQPFHVISFLKHIETQEEIASMSFGAWLPMSM